jgi:hypothetical protein
MSKIIELTSTRGGRWACLVVVNSRKGNSIFTKPFVKHKKKPTDNQVNTRRKFMLASRYAKNVLQNPDILAAYTAKSRPGLTPYILAVTDYLKPPFIDQLDTSAYSGNPGDKISVTAGDDFEVASVFVKILTPAGVLIEQGARAFNLVTGNYDFTVTVQVPDLTGVTITARATDMPGHSDQMTVTL